ncbi:hypothetical protein Trydic_g2356 [Trypoxylus dichotomus]
MRVAFLFLTIFICAGLVLATQDHDGQKNHGGHDRDKIHHLMNRDVDTRDQLRQKHHGLEGRRYDTRNYSLPLLIDILGNIVHTGTDVYPSVPTFGFPLKLRSKGVDDVVSNDSYNDDDYAINSIMRLDDPDTPEVISHRADGSKHSHHEKFGHLESKEKMV